MDAIAAIATAQPEFTEAAAAAALAEHFAVRGTLRPLLSERDQNYHVTTGAGSEFVFKIANRAENPVTTDFQIQALLHIEAQRAAVATPLIQRSVRGEVAVQLYAGGVPHVARLVSYVPGDLLSSVVVSPELAANLGASAAHLDIALAGFEHAGEQQTLLWDMQRADRLRELLPKISAQELRDAVRGCIDDFESRASPVLGDLRRQVIHADLHGDNVLVRSTDHTAVAGVIDFGDMLRAPVIVEVAVAAAYLRVLEGDALGLIVPFVVGFHRVLRLQVPEVELLFDLVRARLAATISILHWRAATRGADDVYSRDYMQSERSAETFLRRLNGIGQAKFTARLLTACGI